MFAVITALAFAIVLVVAGASAMLLERFWLGRGYLAIAYALLGLGLIAQVIWIAYWLLPAAGVVLSFATLAASVVVLVVKPVWSRWRTWLPLVVLTLALGAVYLGFLFLYGGSDDPFTTAALRFRTMPPDNVIQHLFADRLWKGQPTTLVIGDWNGSDRPPLQSGFLLLVRPFEGLFGVAPAADVYDSTNLRFAFAASVAAQLTWIPATYALVRSLGFHGRVASLSVAFVAFIPLTVLNSVYTWPKLLSAGLAVAGIALLIDAARNATHRPLVPFASAATLAILAILSHGGAALALPIFIAIGFIVLRRYPLRRAGAIAAISAACVLALYAPWLLYGRFADPSHDRLLKWHFAGYIPPDNSSFLSRLIEAYTTTPIVELLSNRVSNLQRVFDFSFASRFGEGGIGVAREADFYATTWSIGLGFMLALGFIVTGVGLRVAKKAIGERARISLVLLLAAMASIVLWAVAMFLPDGAVVHQGSPIWLILLAAVPFAWLAEKRPVIAVIALLVQLAYSAIVYWSPIDGQPSDLSRTALMIVIAGGLLSGLAVGASFRLERAMPPHNVRIR